MADPIPGHRERVLLTRLRQKTESKLRTQEEDPPALLIRVSKIDDSSSPPRPAALLRSNRRMIALGSVSSTPVSRQSVRVGVAELWRVLGVYVRGLSAAIAGLTDRVNAKASATTQKVTVFLKNFLVSYSNCTKTHDCDRQ